MTLEAKCKMGFPLGKRDTGKRLPTHFLKPSAGAKSVCRLLYCGAQPHSNICQQGRSMAQPTKHKIHPQNTH